MDSGKAVEKLTLTLDAFKLDIPPGPEEGVNSSISTSSKPPSTDHDDSATSIPTGKTSPINAHPGKNSDRLLINLLDDTELPNPSASHSESITTSRRNELLAKARRGDPTRIEKLIDKPPSTPEALETWLHQKAAIRQDWWNQELGIEEEEEFGIDRRPHRITSAPRWNAQLVNNPTSSEHLVLDPETAQRKTMTPPTFTGRTKQQQEKPERMFGGYGPMGSSNSYYGRFDEQYSRLPGRQPRNRRGRGGNKKASIIPQTNPRPRGNNNKFKTKRIVESSEDESGEEDVKETKQRLNQDITAINEDEAYTPIQGSFRPRVKEKEEEEPLIEL